MKSLKKRNAVHGNEQHSKLRKHETNLPKNGMIRFQVGLLISLMLVYLLINLPFLVHAASSNPPLEVDAELVEYTMGAVRIEEPVKKEVTPEKAPVKNKVVNPTQFTQVANTSLVKETTVTAPEDDTALRVEDVVVADDKDEPIHVNAVEFAPLFPGCSEVLDKNGRIVCMNEKIDRYIQRYFNTGLAEQYGLQGVQRIYVKFTISATGEITDVTVRAPHPALEKEARKIVGKLPVLMPGKQGIKAVDVIFVKPIVFRVD